MSSLKTIEKRVFEDLFGMASGYVLDFSPDKHTAEICLQVLKAAIADLSGGRK
ncbi:hypothetical protein [Geothermobacter hydrogeniphilus]|uniref:hypothetical protein n=1 Tax=Geothermobacter hydrogeniphilus TaxID=1969733 RepID=UPI001304A961|nr:hypothetical protein [Geothermobacter hydrogeniphilus]